MEPLYVATVSCFTRKRLLRLRNVMHHNDIFSYFKYMHRTEKETNNYRSLVVTNPCYTKVSILSFPLRVKFLYHLTILPQFVHLFLCSWSFTSSYPPPITDLLLLGPFNFLCVGREGTTLFYWKSTVTGSNICSLICWRQTCYLALYKK